jgi:nucleotide-binding universal stress UspA family protein
MQGTNECTQDMDNLRLTKRTMEEKMNKVLIAVDGTKGSKGILSLFRELVSSPEQVVLLHVQQLEGNSLMTAMLGDAEMSTLKESMKGTEHKEALDQKTEKILSHYRKELGDSGLTDVKTVVREGNPSDEILKVAEEEGVDLIMVGCSGKSRIHRLVTGCASRHVERNAKVPVLIAKGNGCGEHGRIWNGREAYGVR